MAFLKMNSRVPAKAGVDCSKMSSRSWSAASTSGSGRGSSSSPMPMSVSSQKMRPTTEARWSTSRSCTGRLSRRAWSTPLSVEGTLREVSRPGYTRQRSPSVRMTPSSSSICTSSSR